MSLELAPDGPIAPSSALSPSASSAQRRACPAQCPVSQTLQCPRKAARLKRRASGDAPDAARETPAPSDSERRDESDGVAACPLQAAPGTARSTDPLLAWVRLHLGLSFDAEHREAFASRVLRFCTDEQLNLDQVIRQLEVDESLRRRLENALSTPYTYFMREPEAFAYLASEVLPRFQNEPEVRLWSAAAASGDEAYSMAMVAREFFGNTGPAVRILATDLSAQQVANGECGEVQESHLHDVDDARRKRWFSPSNTPGRMRVARELCAMCTFRRLNLALGPWPFEQKFHAIFLRNVLYYFDDVTVRAVLDAATAQLTPGGALITSVTEPVDFVPRGLVRIASGIYLREGP